MPNECSICGEVKKFYFRVHSEPRENVSRGAKELHDALLSLFGYFPNHDSLVFCNTHSRSLERLASRVLKVDISYCSDQN